MMIRKTILALSTVLFLNIANAAEYPNVVLHHSKGGGSVPLASSTDFGNMKFICDAIGGTKAKVINEKSEGAIHWFNVEATDGNCKGKSGWVSSEHVRLA